MAVENKTGAARMEDLLNKSNQKETENSEKSEVITEDNSTKKEKSDKKSVKKETKPEIPKGRPKSGRIWKNEKTRFSSIVKTKGKRNSFEKRKAIKEELKRVKEASKAIISARQEQKKELKKQRRRDNLQRQEENRKRSEIVQVIKNTSKIKKMKKKHLRNIEKRDTTNM